MPLSSAGLTHIRSGRPTEARPGSSGREGEIPRGVSILTTQDATRIGADGMSVRDGFLEAESLLVGLARFRSSVSP